MIRLIKTIGMVLFLLGCVLASAASAQEVITSYHSAINLSKSGEMAVVETIKVNVEGIRLKRGIYRDFPLTFQDDEGRRHKVDFNLVSVSRDGQSEPYRTENIPDGIRIYTGEQDVLLPAGEHVLEITYETARQIRYFADHDELYWNVTGTEWAFPIGEAVATVTLPDGVRAKALDVFTGGYGSSDKNATAVEDGSEVVFTTTRPLRPQEGLTIAIKLPKGSIDPPAASTEQLWWLKDHLPSVLAIAGLVVVALYYTRMWARVGRDADRGVIVPRWDAPDGISPALANYIDNKGFSGEGWTALSAAALNLAVGGFVVLEDLKNALVITATNKSAPANLPTGESMLLKAVVTEGGKLTIDKANGKTVQKVGASFRSAMEKEHRNRYYLANTWYVLGGVALSVVFLGSIFIFGNLDDTSIALVLVPALASVVISIFAIGLGKALRKRGTLFSRIKAIVFAAFFGFVLFSGAFSLVAFVITTALEAHELPLLIAVSGIILANLLFYYLMGAPTPLGARMMDGIDGLRQYLTLAEKERMNMAGAPEMSPQHFEKLLPYAVALGVEKPWAETFDRWLLAAAAGAAAYQPAWYYGNHFSVGSFGDRMGGFAGSLANTMTASLPPPPKSSSSGFGGGGFSGGGGGGGGGGGW
ncbi:putative membrane protein [Pararhizobium capsulatum DSM 1112]|uniref:Membrane protein n=1 Tax=Pararhizobium capsulatum DSM 1112 TaxID=1121113 RepID=A0ABU0BMA8_9HYPH|nr:DUF2207 domain-containing protein [Pararhizobium capsulatum]MDQ0319376.1 putative membrane protein [Pararhizobium capsulatum DSM 1112]